jgi:hypothetical protein
MGQAFKILIMKLMVVGSDKIFAIENFYFKYLSALGVETKTFNAQSFFFDYYQKGNFKQNNF